MIYHEASVCLFISIKPHEEKQSKEESANR